MPPGLKFTLVAVATLSSSIFALGSGFGVARTASREPTPELVHLRPGAFSYRLSGEFTRDGRPAVPPIVTIRIERTLSIMRGQVSAADYRRCIDAQACPMADQDAASDLPVVKANWYDANAYAAWLSRETGEHWRLPTDEEWAYAAAGLFKDDVLPESFDGSDPGRRALALYDRDASRENAIGKALRPIGGFGENANGLLDIAGNVWEWTDTCFTRNALNRQSEVGTTTVNCGVRAVEGRHRTYMTDFIRDPRIGGCAVGTPPANLGFRLVRDTNSWPGLRLLSSLAQRLFGANA